MTKRRTITLGGGALGLLLLLAGCAWFGGTHAVIDVSVESGVVPLTIAFDGRSSDGRGGIASYQWNFGTGDATYEPNGTYTYEQAGRFTLTLTVRDADGRIDVVTMEIDVSPAIWTCDENLQRVYKLNTAGDVLQTIDLATSEPRGIAVVNTGGQDWLYVACRGGGNQRLLKVDPSTGAVDADFPAPAQDPLYLTFGGADPERLWHVDGLSRNIYAINHNNGQVLSVFGTNYFRASAQVGGEAFLLTPQGLAWTPAPPSSGDLWYLEGDTHLLYRLHIVPPVGIFGGIQLTIDTEPVEVDETVFPVAGMDWYDGGLWVVDRDDHRIVEIDPETGARTGEVIEGFPGAATSGLDIQG